MTNTNTSIQENSPERKGDTEKVMQPGKLDIATAYHAMGANVLPIDGKAPIGKWQHWQTTRQTLADVNAQPWQSATGIGVVHGPASDGWACIDGDNMPLEAMYTYLSAAKLPNDYEWCAQSGSGNGFHIWIRLPHDYEQGTTALDYVGVGGKLGDDPPVHVELRWTGGQTLIAPSRHASGNTYTWLHGEPTEPPTLLADYVALAAYATIHTGVKHVKPGKRSKKRPQTAQGRVSRVLGTSDLSEYKLSVEDGARAKGLFATLKRKTFQGHTAYYGENLSCLNPSHPDKNPSAAFVGADGESGAYLHCQNKGCGGLSTDEVAEYCGLEHTTLQAFSAARRSNGDINLAKLSSEAGDDDTHSVKLSEPIKAGELSTRGDNSRFPGGLPHTVDKFLTQAHTLIDGIDRQVAAAAVYYLWHEIPEDLIPGDVWVKAGDLLEAGARIERNPKRSIIERGLTQLIAWGVIESMGSAELQPIEQSNRHVGEIQQNCNPYYVGETYIGLQNCRISTLRDNTRPTTLYRFAPWPEALAAIEEKRRYHLRAQAFKHDADTAQPEIGNLSDEQIKAWDDYRAPIIDADHHAALADFEEKSGYLDNAVRAIHAGNNWVVTLPPGDIGNARDYRVLKAKARTEKSDITVKQMARDLAVSHSTLARDYEAIGVITIPQSKVVDAAGITPNTIVLNDYGNGKVRIKTSSLLRPRDGEHTTDNERVAFDDLSAKQKERRENAEKLKRLDAIAAVGANKPPAEIPKTIQFETPPKETSETIPANYTDDHKRAQYDLFPLPQDFPGELCNTPDELWQAGAVWLLERITDAQDTTQARVQRGKILSGHTDATSIGAGENQSQKGNRSATPVPESMGDHETVLKKAGNSHHAKSVVRHPTGHTARTSVDRSVKPPQILDTQEGETMPTFTAHSEPKELPDLDTWQKSAILDTCPELPIPDERHEISEAAVIAPVQKCGVLPSLGGDTYSEPRKARTARLLAKQAARTAHIRAKQASEAAR